MEHSPTLDEDSPTVIRVEEVSKHFVMRRDNSLKDRLIAFKAGKQHRETFTALDAVSLDIKAGHTVALIGHNGSGKSTLLKVIGGILDPSAGSISRRGRIAALLELGAGFHPDLSGRDNVFLNASLLGLSRQETEAVFDEIVNFAEIEDFIDTQVKFYSSGMYVRLAFAVAIHTDPDILLVDEVLAVGDEAFQRKCMDTIRRFQAEGRTILLVTHNLNQVLELCDSAALLHHGRLVYNGEPREAVAQFRDLLEDRRLEHEATQHAHAQKEGTEFTPAPPPALQLSAQAFGPHQGEPIRPGETLTVSVQLTGKLALDEWICGIQIDSTLGQAVLGTTTLRLDHPVEPIQGNCELDFTFQNAQFGEGKFFVNISVMDINGTHLFDLPQACSFNAQGTERATGIMYAYPEVTTAFSDAPRTHAE